MDKIKQFKEISDKTSLDDSDRILLSTANGARRIPKANLISEIKGDAIPGSYTVSPKAGDWIRVARFIMGGFSKMGVFVFMPSYINTGPVPFIMSFSWATTSTGSYHYVWPQFNYQGLSRDPVFDRMRVTQEKTGDGYGYLEFHVSANHGWSSMRYGFMWKSDQIETVPAKITTDSDLTVLYECDLKTQTTSLNTQAMQQADLQAKMGGGITAFPIGDYVVAVRQKGGLPDESETSVSSPLCSGNRADRQLHERCYRYRQPNNPGLLLDFSVNVGRRNSAGLWSFRGSHSSAEKRKQQDSNFLLRSKLWIHNLDENNLFRSLGCLETVHGHYDLTERKEVVA